MFWCSDVAIFEQCDDKLILGDAAKLGRNDALKKAIYVIYHKVDYDLMLKLIDLVEREEEGSDEETDNESGDER